MNNRIEKKRINLLRNCKKNPGIKSCIDTLYNIVSK